MQKASAPSEPCRRLLLASSPEARRVPSASTRTGHRLRARHRKSKPHLSDQKTNRETVPKPMASMVAEAWRKPCIELGACQQQPRATRMEALPMIHTDPVAWCNCSTRVDIYILLLQLKILLRKSSLPES
uniref:Uncharacterized protein n=1 Tax=Oryza punctata TaxID=4537 RepID=A0A0E0MP39_ORYPU